MLPPPFGLIFPPSVFQFVMFMVSVSLTLCVVSAYCLIDVGSVFYTMSRYNVIFVIAADFFAGNYIPLPFFPESIKKIVEFSPFGAMANAPLRIYSGDIEGTDAILKIGLQLFWFAVLLFFGKGLIKKALRRVVAQGG
jgi:ABC-2 type transport system permease protein